MEIQIINEKHQREEKKIDTQKQKKRSGKNELRNHLLDEYNI